MIMMQSFLFMVSFPISNGCVVVGVDSSDRLLSSVLYSVMRTKRRSSADLPVEY